MADKKYRLTFAMSDGTSQQVDFTAPQGPRGAKGDAAVGALVKSDLLSYVYPVGSIYMSVNSTSPASFLGGTWVRIQDRFLLAAGSSYSAGSTGGEAKHTLTIKEIAAHAHGTNGTGVKWGSSAASAGTIITTSSWGSAKAVTKAEWGTNGCDVANQMFTDQAAGITGNAGGGQPHNNMPPYLAVYIWKRTA